MDAVAPPPSSLHIQAKLHTIGIKIFAISHSFYEDRHTGLSHSTHPTEKACPGDPVMLPKSIIVREDGL
jgi:hypothetical protein